MSWSQLVCGSEQYEMSNIRVRRLVQGVDGSNNSGLSRLRLGIASRVWRFVSALTVPLLLRVPRGRVPAYEASSPAAVSRHLRRPFPVVFFLNPTSAIPLLLHVSPACEASSPVCFPRESPYRPFRAGHHEINDKNVPVNTYQ